MNRALLIAAFLFPAAAWAQTPDTGHWKCQRWKSKCVGKTACEKRAEELKADKEHKILSMRKLEIADYIFDSKNARETIYEPDQPTPTLTDEDRRTFHNVTLSPQTAIIENKTSAGKLLEQITIDRALGFYSDYTFHLDGSVKDVPIGEPFVAYFGWCDKQ